MNDLDKAIKTCEDNAEFVKYHGTHEDYLYHRELAEWLKELKAFRCQAELNIIAEGMKEQNHCGTCLNQHTDKCNHCMVTEYHGQRVSNPTGYEQEPCDDAISRAYIEPIVEELENICINGDEYILNLLADIKNAPSVTQKSGEWIDTDEWCETVDGFEQWGYFRKCSKCGYVFKFLEIDNYCPNCGARMESEE